MEKGAVMRGIAKAVRAMRIEVGTRVELNGEAKRWMLDLDGPTLYLQTGRSTIEMAEDVQEACAVLAGNYVKKRSLAN